MSLSPGATQASWIASGGLLPRALAVLGSILPLVAGCAGETTTTAQAPSPPPPAAVRTMTLPPSLVGLSDESLRRVLGRPTLQRREPPGEIWQYTGEQCVLLVVLYRPPDGGRATVAQVNALSTADAPTPAATGAEETTDRCLATLTRLQRSGIES
ncbi:hypothetical protein [Zavarzinia sp. CC-PAN008]|uniref:hypothetical protein n=1 Tax=Zavarzinia sp. CC-PAN008 TaxID=3243332 RepID=UPI003F7431BF